MSRDVSTPDDKVNDPFVQSRMTCEVSLTLCQLELIGCGNNLIYLWLSVTSVNHKARHRSSHDQIPAPRQHGDPGNLLAQTGTDHLDDLARPPILVRKRRDDAFLWVASGKSAIHVELLFRSEDVDRHVMGERPARHPRRVEDISDRVEGQDERKDGEVDDGEEEGVEDDLG